MNSSKSALALRETFNAQKNLVKSSSTSALPKDSASLGYHLEETVSTSPTAITKLQTPPPGPAPSKLQPAAQVEEPLNATTSSQQINHPPTNVSPSGRDLLERERDNTYSTYMNKPTTESTNGGTSNGNVPETWVDQCGGSKKTKTCRNRKRIVKNTCKYKRRFTRAHRKTRKHIGVKSKKSLLAIKNRR
jgi:hypothetical protein